jgi:hypothetical protein
MTRTTRSAGILTKNGSDISDVNAKAKLRKSLGHPENTQTNSNDEPQDPVWGDDLPDWMRKL